MLKDKAIEKAITNSYGVKTKGFYYADVKKAVNKLRDLFDIDGGGSEGYTAKKIDEIFGDFKK